jgi:hypothetical protein
MDHLNNIQASKRKYRRHALVAMLYFAFAAILGVLLRFYSLSSFTFNYRYLVHAHSHIALLGWVYVALTTILHYCFVKNDTTAHKRYTWIFWATQGTLIGMMLTFPFQGYALFSIIFSTLFLIISYIFFHHFLKNIDPKHKDGRALQCMKAALWFMVISSLGPWALGMIMTLLGSQSIWYRIAIYFYLHFQYNGWMVLALIGLVLFALEQQGMVFPKKRFSRFFWSMNIGIVLTFFLSTLWTDPSPTVYVLAGIGTLSQLGAFGVLWVQFKGEAARLLLTKWQVMLLKLVVVLFCIKLLLQLLTTLPYFVQMATRHIDLIIGYLHLTFLGVISIGLFFLMDYFKLFQVSRRPFQWYFLGFLTMEILIFYRGMAGWLQWPLWDGHTETLAVGSLLILLSLLWMLLKNWLPS